LPANHPNSFVVPISVNLDRYEPDGVKEQARFVFHRLMRALAHATQGWDRVTLDEAADKIPASVTDARLGPPPIRDGHSGDPLIARWREATNR
jgi:hypothetical protein